MSLDLCWLLYISSEPGPLPQSDRVINPAQRYRNVWLDFSRIVNLDAKDRSQTLKNLLNPIIIIQSQEKAMAPHSSTLAWKIPWMEEPGRLQSMGSLSVTHDWATSLSCIGEGNGNPLQYSCLENPRYGGAWWAAVHGVTQSQTQLKRLSSSSSSSNLR